MIEPNALIPDITFSTVYQKRTAVCETLYEDVVPGSESMYFGFRCPTTVRAHFGLARARFRGMACIWLGGTACKVDAVDFAPILQLFITT